MPAGGIEWVPMQAETRQLESVENLLDPGEPPEPVAETSHLRVVFRGYDMAQVDELVASLVAGQRRQFSMPDPADSATRAGIERISAKTKVILMAAQESAESLRAEAASESAVVRAEADAYAERVRDEADRDSARVMREGHAERLRIEAQIDGLREHRDTIVANLERLRGNLDEVVDESGQGTFGWTAVEEDAEEIDGA